MPSVLAWAALPPNAIARANALAENHDTALKYYDLAAEAAEVVKDKEDKELVLADLEGGDWFGIK